MCTQNFIATKYYSHGWITEYYVSVPRGPLSYNVSMIIPTIDLLLLSVLGVLINEMRCCIDWKALKSLYTRVSVLHSFRSQLQSKPSQTSGDKWLYFLLTEVFLTLQDAFSLGCSFAERKG